MAEGVPRKLSATKSEVQSLARQVYGVGASVSARQTFTTWWAVEVTEISEGRPRLAMTGNAKTLREAYGSVAVRLRVRVDDALAARRRA